MSSDLLQVERLWPDEQDGPWLLRVSFSVSPSGWVEPVGVEMWAGGPPDEASGEARWTPGMKARARAKAVIPIDAGALRLPLARLAQDAVAQAARFLPIAEVERRPEADLLAGMAAARRPRGRPALYPPSHFAAVADAYRHANPARPTADVADAFSVSRATAAKWIARCRQMGLLEPAQA